MCSTQKRTREGKILSLHESSSFLSSPSASLIGSNVDLLSKIVLCLPIKSIIAFKSVSKQWNSIITSDSSFQKSIKKKYPSGFVMRRFICLKNVTQEFKYNFIKKDATCSIPLGDLGFGRKENQLGIKIDQSCNGLLLCHSSVLGGAKRGPYYVYNPLTRQYKLIPPKNGICYVAYVGLAFDPSKSPYYKVIILRQYARGGYRIHIYSSETSTLKKCGEKFQVQARVLYSVGVYWNGCLNWIGDKGSLVYFEVDQEIIKHVTMTQYVIDRVMKKIHYFDVCKGHLQMIVQDKTGVGSSFDVLEMDTAYTGWNLKHRIDLESGLKLSYPGLVGENLNCKVMLYDEVDSEGEGSPKLFLLICSPMTYGVISYNIKDKQFKRIANMKHQCLFPGTCGSMGHLISIRLYQHTASLARV